jgi:Pyruvate/2-oxoacid:ferredoxin oxidoreductase gamma subunit
MNIVLLGAAVKALTAAHPETMEGIVWEEIIKTTVKPAFIDVNIKAFAAGQTDQ